VVTVTVAKDAVANSFSSQRMLSTSRWLVGSSSSSSSGSASSARASATRLRQPPDSRSTGASAPACAPPRSSREISSSRAPLPSTEVVIGDACCTLQDCLAYRGALA